MTKLSELKVGDRFTVEAKIILQGRDVTRFVLNGAPDFVHNQLSVLTSKVIVVTKLPDPPRPLVKGERIETKEGAWEPGRKGEYLGRYWVWWDNTDAPSKLSQIDTTEFYTVIEDPK